MTTNEQLSNTVQSVLNGNLDPLEAQALFAAEKKELKERDEYLKKCESEIYDLVIEQIESYPEGCKVHGCEFTKVSGRAIWNFKSIPEWQEADKIRKEVEERAKLAYKSKTKGIAASFDGDGVEIELPEVKYTDDSIRVKPLK